MAEPMNIEEMKNKFDEASFMLKITIMFTSAVRMICSSNLAPEIKADAMGLAVKFFQSNIEVDMIDRILRTQEAVDVPLDLVFRVCSEHSIKRSANDETKLRNILELFNKE